MRPSADAIRRFRNLASVTRALFVVGFTFDVLSLLVFQRYYWMVEGVDANVPWRLGYSSAEILLGTASAAALVLALWQAAVNVRGAAPHDSILWRLEPKSALPWNDAGRRAVLEL